MTAPLAPIWQVLDPRLLEDLRLLYGLPRYQVVADLDSLPEDEWRRLMQEKPRPGRGGA